MSSLLVLSVFASMAVIFASDYAAVPVAYQRNSHAFHGHYPGRCGNDGFYYKDQYSFIICSNGNSYDQPCAPGTRNSEYGRFNHGHAYHYRDFCDVNLVDFGFGAHRSAGYGHAAPVVHGAVHGGVAHGVAHGVVHSVAHKVVHGVAHGVAHGAVHGGAVHGVAHEVVHGVSHGAVHGGAVHGVAHEVVHGVSHGAVHGGAHGPAFGGYRK